jgi:hypothetical protein
VTSAGDELRPFSTGVGHNGDVIGDLMALIAGPRKTFAVLKQALLVLTVLLAIVAVILVGFAIFAT